MSEENPRDDYAVMLRYPELFGADNGDAHSIFREKFRVHDGWLPIIHELLLHLRVEVIKEQIEDFRIIQMKEKFAELRIYAHGKRTDEINRLLDAAKEKSAVTCEYCGGESEQRWLSGWATTTCDACLPVVVAQRNMTLEQLFKELEEIQKKRNQKH